VSSIVRVTENVASQLKRFCVHFKILARFLSLFCFHVYLNTCLKYLVTLSSNIKIFVYFQNYIGFIVIFIDHYCIYDWLLIFLRNLKCKQSTVTRDSDGFWAGCEHLNYEHEHFNTYLIYKLLDFQQVDLGHQEIGPSYPQWGWLYDCTTGETCLRHTLSHVKATTSHAQRGIIGVYCYKSFTTIKMLVIKLNIYHTS